MIVSRRLNGGNERWIGLQRGAAVQLEGVQLVEIGGTAIEQRRGGGGAPALGGLQLRRVGRQRRQMHVGWDAEPRAQAPPRWVHDQHELLVRTRSCLLRQGGQRAGDHLDVAGGAQMPLRAPRGRRRLATPIPPARARMNRDHRPLSFGRPAAAQDGLEPAAMLIAGPHRHRRSRMRRRHRRYLGLQLLFQAVRSAGLAALGWRGRGAWGVKSSRRR